MSIQNLKYDVPPIVRLDAMFVVLFAVVSTTPFDASIPVALLFVELAAHVIFPIPQIFASVFKCEPAIVTFTVTVLRGSLVTLKFVAFVNSP